jgi:hypothetical protein
MVDWDLGLGLGLNFGEPCKKHENVESNKVAPEAPQRLYRRVLVGGNLLRRRSLVSPVVCLTSALFFNGQHRHIER